MIEVNVTVTDNHGNTISLAHGDVANLQYLLGNLVKPLGWPMPSIHLDPSYDPGTWKISEEPIKNNAEVVQTSEESGDGCAKYPATELVKEIDRLIPTMY